MLSLINILIKLVLSSDQSAKKSPVSPNNSPRAPVSGEDDLSQNVTNVDTTANLPGGILSVDEASASKGLDPVSNIKKIFQAIKMH